MNPTEDKNKYPFFEANQVLTNVHLNQAIDYLDEQERLTRANLIGIGIVCGLEMIINAENATITITKGCGISSEGYIMVLSANKILSRYKPYVLPDEKDSGKYSPFLKWDETSLDKPKKIPYDLMELVPDDEDNKINADLLTSSILLDDKAVLLFLELRPDRQRNCSANNCDDQGAEIKPTVRYLLVTKTDLDEIITTSKSSAGPDSFDLKSVLSAQLNLPDLHLPRYNLPDSKSTTSGDVLKAFHNIFQEAQLATQVGKALGMAYNAFRPILQSIAPDGNPFADFNTQFGFLDNDLLPTNRVRFLQNYYDFFGDLIKAYNEFRWKGITLLCACCPSDTLFPRHLMLGLITPDVPETNTAVYRHYFTPSPAGNSCDKRLKERKELELLFNRLITMIKQFTDDPHLSQDDPQIRVTPSKLADIPLSDQAIPYYYQQSGTPPLFTLWSAEKTRRNQANQNLSYRSDEYIPKAPAFVTNALFYDLEPYNFLRIEGHLGKNHVIVMKTLSALKTDYRLPIEIITLHTGNSAQNPTEVLHNFLIKHPGIQHKAGAPLGGTFLLICHASVDDAIYTKQTRQGDVIADFFLPYPVIEADCHCQMLTKECEYEWIDSIKHINNLTLRDYRAIATAKAPAAHEQESKRLKNNYIIRIYRYEVQGKSLLSGVNPEDIIIPVSTLKADKLSAIARKLNETYPLGLVFDYKPDSNKMLIRRLEGHGFYLELAGVQGNQIRYLYENDKIYRWQQETWEELDNTSGCDISCHISGGAYKEDDYKWLHENYKPKYPAPPVSPTAKEVIQWEKLTLKRAPSSYRVMNKLPVFNSVLPALINAILQIDSNAGIVLIGSWANGSWVSLNPKENEKMIGTMAWPEFLQLRKKVTGKSGHSDIELLIDSELEITHDMIKVSTGYAVKLIRGKRNAQKGLVPFFLLGRQSAQGKNMMQPGEVLNPGQAISIPGPSTYTAPLGGLSLYSFTYQVDGNLVFNEMNMMGGGNYIRWTSGTAGKPVGICIMQSDGNLVIYGPNGEYVWETATGGNPDSYLLLLGPVVEIIYPDSVNGTVIWAK